MDYAIFTIFKSFKDIKYIEYIILYIDLFLTKATLL